MKRLLKTIASIRNFCELVAVLLFLLYWPAANLYLVVCGAFLLAGKAIGSTVGEVVAVIGLFMAFLVPLWSLAVIGIYYLSTALAIASLRPVPLILLSVAFLEWERYIPSGFIGMNDIGKMMGWRFDSWPFDRWLYPTMYSALAMLGGIFVLRSVRVKA